MCYTLSGQVRDLWTKANTRMSAEGDGSLEAHVRTQPSSQYSIIWHALSNMQRSTDCSAMFKSLARGPDHPVRLSVSHGWQVPAHGVAMYRLRHRQCPFVMGVYARGMGDGVECSKLRI